eukprot:s689_g14.t1
MAKCSSAMWTRFDRTWALRPDFRSLDMRSTDQQSLWLHQGFQTQTSPLGGYDFYRPLPRGKTTHSLQTPGLPRKMALRGFALLRPLRAPCYICAPRKMLLTLLNPLCRLYVRPWDTDWMRQSATSCALHTC